MTRRGPRIRRPSPTWIRAAYQLAELFGYSGFRRVPLAELRRRLEHRS